MNLKIKKGGISILGILLIGVLLVFVLSYFNISIQSLTESPAVQKNMEYIRDVAKNVWDDYLKKPLAYVWDKLILKGIDEIKNMEPLDVNKLNPGIPQ